MLRKISIRGCAEGGSNPVVESKRRQPLNLPQVFVQLGIATKGNGLAVACHRVFVLLTEKAGSIPLTWLLAEAERRRQGDLMAREKKAAPTGSASNPGAPGVRCE